jgi:hypothetical protein
MQALAIWLTRRKYEVAVLKSHIINSKHGYSACPVLYKRYRDSTMAASSQNNA